MNNFLANRLQKNMISKLRHLHSLSKIIRLPKLRIWRDIFIWQHVGFLYKNFKCQGSPIYLLVKYAVVPLPDWAVWRVMTIHEELVQAGLVEAKGIDLGSRGLDNGRNQASQIS